MVSTWIERDVNSDPFVAEALATLLSLKLAKENNWSKIICEGDYSKFINALKGYPNGREWRGDQCRKNHSC